MFVERWLSWSKAHDWKSCVGLNSPRVRIPLSPPKEDATFDTISKGKKPLVIGVSCYSKRKALNLRLELLLLLGL